MKKIFKISIIIAISSIIIIVISLITLKLITFKDIASQEQNVAKTIEKKTDDYIDITNTTKENKKNEDSTKIQNVGIDVTKEKILELKKECNLLIKYYTVGTLSDRAPTHGEYALVDTNKIKLYIVDWKTEGLKEHYRIKDKSITKKEIDDLLNMLKNAQTLQATTSGSYYVIEIMNHGVVESEKILEYPKMPFELSIDTPYGIIR